MKKITILDIIISVLIFAILIYLFVNSIITKDNSNAVLLINAPSGEYYYYLDQDKTVQIKGAIGITTIKIEKGRFSFVDSPCTHKDCVRMGWIKNNNYPVICLPNEVTAYIINKKSKIEYDEICK